MATGHLMASPSDVRSRSARLVRIGAWTFALVLGGWQAWFGRFVIAGDGISYLDMGDAYLRGDWATALNAYWSPLYAWLLGLALWAVRPGPQWEYAVVAAVNMLAYVFALACFQYFWMGVFHSRREGGVRERLPEPIWIALGFGVSIWMGLSLIRVSNVAPDMCVAGFVFLATGLLIRMAAGERQWTHWVVLGAILGLGYLTKTPMFLLAFVFLGCSWFVAGGGRLAVFRVALATVLFLATAGPFVAAISQTKGRFTFGDSGRINYAWDVNGVPRFGWRGGPAGLGTPTHPVRVLYDEPGTLEIDAERFRGVTLPLWYDPSYWYDGVTPRFELSGLGRPILESVGRYVQLYRDQHGLLAGLLALSLIGGDPRRWLREALTLWPVWIPGLAGLGLFTLAGAETRYVAPFAALLLAAAIATVRYPGGEIGATRAVTIAVAVALYGELLLVHAKPDVPHEEHHENYAVARGLHELGVAPGDRVALVHPREDPGTVYWARLAGVRVTALVRPARIGSFWGADPDKRAAAIAAMVATGVTAVVAPSIPPGVDADGWTRVDKTEYHALIVE